MVSEKKISDDVAKYYVNALTRKNIVFNRNTTKAYRQYAIFAFQRGLISKQFRDDILDEIKIPRSEHDLYVPTLEEVKKTLAVAKEYSDNVYYVYRIALESGARLSEIFKASEEPERDVCSDGICYYPLSWTRGYKGSFYLFHLTPLRHVDITRFAINDFIRKRKGVVAIKYIRKFVASVMATLGIGFDTIDFIQGRKPTRVLTQHYVQLFSIAKREYSKYVSFLKGLDEMLAH
ncbi:integrase [Acidianus sp. DSM 29099]|nr:integrase [Acidianus sp. RZ1]